MMRSGLQQWQVVGTTEHSFTTFKALVPEIQILLSKWTAWSSAQLRSSSDAPPRALASQVAASNACMDTLQRQSRSMQTHLKQLCSGERVGSNPSLIRVLKPSGAGPCSSRKLTFS